MEQTPQTSGSGGLPEDRPWSAREAAYYLNVSEALVRKLEQLGRLPALPRIGRRINFDPKVVKQFRENPKKFKPRGG